MNSATRKTKHMPDEQQLEMAVSNDAVAKAATPAATPEGWEGKTFEIPYLPAFFTVTDAQTAETYGPFSKDDFVSEPNGILFAHDPETGTAVVFRAVWQAMKGSELNIGSIDANGERQVFIVDTLPENELEIETPNL